MRPAVFLDRDDTLIANRALAPPNPPPPNWKRGDLADPARVELLPGAHEACQILYDAGYVLIIITNQGGVARGNATLDDVHATNRRVMELLAREKDQPVGQASGLSPPRPSTEAAEKAGDRFTTLPSTPSLIAATYFCPFHPEGRVPEFTREHPSRKPQPGMLRAAASDFDLDLSRSWLIGDAQRDTEAGRAAGLAPTRCLQIRRDEPTIIDAARRIRAENHSRAHE